eukprot:195805-Chlamydomonas_euryale.AAC.1
MQPHDALGSTPAVPAPRRMHAGARRPWFHPRCTCTSPNACGRTTPLVPSPLSLHLAECMRAHDAPVASPAAPAPRRMRAAAARAWFHPHCPHTLPNACSRTTPLVPPPPPLHPAECMRPRHDPGSTPIAPTPCRMHAAARRHWFHPAAPAPRRTHAAAQVMEHGRKGVADRQASMQEAAAARRAAAARAAAADPQEDLVNQ